MKPRQLYRMHDVDHGGAIPCKPGEATEWNTPARGFGVYWTVNDFAGARRIERLTCIRSWAVDIDEGDKQVQAAKIMRAPLVPSLIVETKRGYQVYYDAIDAKAEHWNAIVLDRLVPYFGADKNARDLARILRAPGFWHLKNPAEPFMCEARSRTGAAYTEIQIAEKFPDHGAARRVEVEIAREAASKADIARLGQGRTHEPSEDRTRRYVEAAFNGEVSAVASQAEGGRNARLFRAAAALGGLVAAGALGEGEVTIALRDAALRAGLGSIETDKTISSGLRAGKSKPRTLPRAA